MSPKNKMRFSSKNLRKKELSQSALAFFLVFILCFTFSASTVFSADEQQSVVKKEDAIQVKQEAAATKKEQLRQQRQQKLAQQELKRQEALID